MLRTRQAGIGESARVLIWTQWGKNSPTLVGSWMCASIFIVFCALEGKMGIDESTCVDLDAVDKNSPPPFADWGMNPV